MSNDHSPELIEATIIVIDPAFNDEKLQEIVQTLRVELIEGKVVKQADLIPIETAPPGAKSIGGFVKGSLKAIAELTQLKPLAESLGNRLFGQTIEIEIEKQFLRGKKLKVKLQSVEDLEKIMPEIEKFMKK